MSWFKKKEANPLQAGHTYYVIEDGEIKRVTRTEYKKLDATAFTEDEEEIAIKTIARVHRRSEQDVARTLHMSHMAMPCSPIGDPFSDHRFYGSITTERVVGKKWMGKTHTIQIKRRRVKNGYV